MGAHSRGSLDSLLMRMLRPAQSSPRHVRLDLLWLIGIALLLIGAGIGLRDPWPADEPRFALIARDMVASQQWLIPRVGGDLYPDKPPLFFWLIAIGLQVTGSLRLSFLLPSLLAAVGSLMLVYDLGRRLWNRETGFIAALALLFTVQFVWQARQAQIDATLCFFTTLSLYGLLRHCLVGPDWKWYIAGWFAAGLGIITKGVGFLPLLVLVPYALCRRSWSPRPVIRGGWRWLLGPVALLVAVSLWLVPMLLAARTDPALAAYRDEILFGQTMHRYAAAWHHHEPFWYFIVNVIPGLWLPLTALLPWLIPAWRQSLRQRDLRTLLLLAWVLLVVLFFSFSSGKRGVYVLPALPAFVLACSPWLAAIAQRRVPQRVLFGLAAALAGVTLAGALILLVNSSLRQELLETYGIDAVWALLLMGVAGAAACAATGRSRAFATWGLTLFAVLGVVSFVVNPAINDSRSGAALMQRAQAMSAGVRELGLVGYKEQYLLYLDRPVVNFGHARWREGQREAEDAAAWQSRRPGRVLLMDEVTRESCFGSAVAREVGVASRRRWFLVEEGADEVCIARGRATVAIDYRPPRES